MKKLFVFFFIMVFLNILLYSQTNDLEILKRINEYRKTKEISEIKIDSSLSNSTKILYRDFSSKEEINEDSVRKILQSQRNFDYHYVVINFKLDSPDEFNLTKYRRKNRELDYVLSDSSYNKIGYSIQKNGGEYYLVLIATQNYIEFCDTFYGNINIYTTYTDEYLVFCGHTSLREIYYQISRTDIDEIKIDEQFKKRIETDINNYFEIKVEVLPNSRSRQKELIVFDKNGKTLSLIKYK